MKKYHRELRRALESLGARRVAFFAGGKHLVVSYELAGEPHRFTTAHSPQANAGERAKIIARQTIRDAQNKRFTPGAR